MKKYWKIFLNFLLIYSILMSAIGISLDTVNTLKYGAVDLRNRVVGTRVLLDGEDPYFFKWNQDTPEEIVDARDFYPNFPMSRLTVPPTVLLLHSPFASIPYKTQQILWAIIQWILLLFSILLLSNTTDSIVKKKILWIIGLLVIASSFFWRLHIDKGQIYILFLFMITLSYWLIKKKDNQILSGFILGLTASFRPPVILMGIPLLIKKRWKFIFSGLAGMLISFVSSLFIAPLSIWRSYFNSMEFHEKFHLLIIHPAYGFFNKHIVDGIKNAIFSANLPIEDSSIQDLLRIFFDLKIKANILELSLIVFILVLTALLWKRIVISKDSFFLYYIGVMLVILSSFFLPAARLSYMNIYWLFPLSLIILITNDIKKILQPELIFVIVGLFLNTMFYTFPKGVILSDYLMLFYIVITTFRITNSKY
ncbi:MAG: glycosyltransferase family 87 protein [Candidatus Cloacimonadota bacterium]|nr:glycosyltransferase family 87 protein [Candidatus Cloacimonadota bacterium]